MLPARALGKTGISQEECFQFKGFRFPVLSKFSDSAANIYVASWGNIGAYFLKLRIWTRLSAGIPLVQAELTNG